MNTTPQCEFKIIGHNAFECEARAEWRILDKTDGKIVLSCKEHLATMVKEGHTISMCPARSHAKEDGIGLTVGEARSKMVCRICGDKEGARRRPDGTMESFWYGYGKEFAHNDCLEGKLKAVKKEIDGGCDEEGTAYMKLLSTVVTKTTERPVYWNLGKKDPVESLIPCRAQFGNVTLDPGNVTMEIGVKIPMVKTEHWNFHGVLPIEKVETGFICAIDKAVSLNEIVGEQ